MPTPQKLTAIINDRCNPISELIGRDAAPRNVLRTPKFETVEPKSVRFGLLGMVLDKLSK